MRHDRHNVLESNPHVKSLAALVLLTRKLAPKPVGYRVWLKYRSWYLRQHQRAYGEFKCFYCGKGPLKKQTDDTKVLATLDHVHPTSKGGAKFHSSNIVVACHPCNNRKQDKSVDEFMNRKRQ